MRAAPRHCGPAAFYDAAVHSIAWGKRIERRQAGADTGNTCSFCTKTQQAIAERGTCRLLGRGQRFLVRRALQRAARLEWRNLRHVQANCGAPHFTV
jgi:hypothetical protein